MDDDDMQFGRPADGLLLTRVPDDQITIEAAGCNQVVLHTQGADHHPPQPRGKTSTGPPRQVHHLYMLMARSEYKNHCPLMG